MVISNLTLAAAVGETSTLDLSSAGTATPVRVLDSMSYLRGATMKIGQTLANVPDIVLREFVETLERLHFEAPPMHWSLLKELVHNELGGDPLERFAAFDRRAFAAASLGQVHRGQLKTGEQVAVKIQYPGIARTISEDIRNLLLFLLPKRFGRDWENMQAQFDDLRMRLEQETDYELEAANLEKARKLFRTEDGVVVPRAYPQYSTKRVLTMEMVPGVHLDRFLATNPSQERRNDAAAKMLRAWYRLMYSGRLLYNDLHPGNFLFLDDGRLGVIDFGSTVLGYVAGDDAHNEAIDLAGRAPDVATARKISDAYKPVYDKLYRDKFGIQVLGVWPYPAQVIFCNGEIKGLADLKGKKVRTANRTLAEFVGQEHILGEGKMLRRLLGEQVNIAANAIGVPDVRRSTRSSASSAATEIM